MLIKDNFVLMKNVPNLLNNVTDSMLESYEKEENSPRLIFTFLKQREKVIKNHFTKKRIYKLISDIKEREKLHVVKFDTYLLPVSHNQRTGAMIVNLKPYDVDELIDLSPSNAYALLVYAFCFAQLTSKRVKINESFAKPIVDYLLSMFVKVFGKEYGLLGIYASGIPKLKFLLACYILAAFFGNQTNISLLRKAERIAPYSYKDEESQIMTYDFQRIDQFLKCLSDLKVMPGVKTYGFASKLYRFFGDSFLPAIEDLSRFISVLVTSDIKGATISRSFLYTYNEKAFDRIMEIARKVFR